MKRKTVVALVLLAALLGIMLFLTLQSRDGTREVSGWIRQQLRAYYRTWRNTPQWVRETSVLRSMLHIPEYFVLGAILYLLWRSLDRGILAAGLITVACAAGIGLAEEGLKLFLPTRHFDALDWLRDILGAAAAVLLCMAIAALLERRRRRRRPDSAQTPST